MHLDLQSHVGDIFKTIRFGMAHLLSVVLGPRRGGRIARLLTLDLPAVIAWI